MTRSLSAALCSAVFAACLLNVAQAADNFPNRAVRLIIPFPVGGSTDILARVVAQKTTEFFGQQVVVDNRPGAGAIHQGTCRAGQIAAGKTEFRIVRHRYAIPLVW